MRVSDRVPRCVAIGPSSSSGCFGIQADLKTFSALGVYGAAVITGVGPAGKPGQVQPLDSELVLSQLLSAIEYVGVASAIKIGRLCSSETARLLAEEIEGQLSDIPLVLDPSLFCRSGTMIADEETTATVCERLLPMATVVTLNIAEAEHLVGRPLPDATSVENAGKELLEHGARSIVIEGGHRAGAFSDDVLVLPPADTAQPSTLWLRSARISIDRLEGIGCTLSSGIAAGISRGHHIDVATEEAKIYLTAALRAGSRWQSTDRTGPLHHFYAWWNYSESEAENLARSDDR